MKPSKIKLSQYVVLPFVTTRLVSSMFHAMGYTDPGFSQDHGKARGSVSADVRENIPWPKQMVLKTGAAEHEPLAGSLASPPRLKKDGKGGGREESAIQSTSHEHCYKTMSHQVNALMQHVNLTILQREEWDCKACVLNCYQSVQLMHCNDSNFILAAVAKRHVTSRRHTLHRPVLEDFTLCNSFMAKPDRNHLFQRLKRRSQRMTQTYCVLWRIFNIIQNSGSGNEIVK